MRNTYFLLLVFAFGLGDSNLEAGDFFAKRGYAIHQRHDDFNGEATAQRGQAVGNEVVDSFLAGTFGFFVALQLLEVELEV